MRIEAHSNPSDAAWRNGFASCGLPRVRARLSLRCPVVHVLGQGTPARNQHPGHAELRVSGSIMPRSHKFASVRTKLFLWMFPRCAACRLAAVRRATQTRSCRGSWHRATPSILPFLFCPSVPSYVEHFRGEDGDKHASSLSRLCAYGGWPTHSLPRLVRRLVDRLLKVYLSTAAEGTQPTGAGASILVDESSHQDWTVAAVLCRSFVRASSYFCPCRAFWASPCVEVACPLRSLWLAWRL